MIRRMLMVTLLAAAGCAGGAQLSRVHEQFYLPGSFNWQFRKHYPGADRLFNAFDYGHAILYEELYRHPGAPVNRLEVERYDFITRSLLTNPPRVPLEESAIEVEYAKLAPEAKLMFEWAHVLHRQLYDVLADERLTRAQKDATIARLLRYYRTRPDLAFSARPKSMQLMEGQHFSLAFRRQYPKFNGLIWAYHWLQVGLYEPLVRGESPEARQRGVAGALGRFRQMLESPPESMPRVMPMTPAIAPEFTRRYPEAAIIFDNLHSMHDVISDILASDHIPRSGKRAEILRYAGLFRDDTSYIDSRAEWLAMAEGMGVANMGGPAVDLMSPLPIADVAPGSTMEHRHQHQPARPDTSAAERKPPDPHAGHRPPR